MFWLISRFLAFYRANKGKRLTLMTVPDGYGEVRTVSVPVLGLYFGVFALSTAILVTIIVFWNYYSVRNNYATTFDLLQRKNTQYEAVLDTSKEQKEVVESLIDETEDLKLKVKQLENAFTDVNRMLEQTGNRPVQLPPLPERKETVNVATIPVFKQTSRNQSTVSRLNINELRSTIAFSGIALAATKTLEYDIGRDEDKTVEELLLDLQSSISSIEVSLANLEAVSVSTKNRLAKLKYDQDHTPNIWPAKAYISSAYGWRNHPILNERKRHTGVDIGVLKGTPVKATADGIIKKAGWVTGYGILVQIDHGNGIDTLYGHLSRSVVKKGDVVKKGQLIAYSGNTGVSTGDHLHYEVRVNGRDVNPLNYLP
ncbi:MAG: M23 family metallopeptidase [Firmicutes bacterium]|nr:M23 family metallopeptidase [Bacillota bacterium]MDD4694792.1 M23 family metallopeptidase [Bacillota bacterium]